MGFVLSEDGKLNWYNYSDRKSIEHHFMHMKKSIDYIMLQLHYFDYGETIPTTDLETYKSTIEWVKSFCYEVDCVQHSVDELENFYKLVPAEKLLNYQLRKERKEKYY